MQNKIVFEFKLQQKLKKNYFYMVFLIYNFSFSFLFFLINKNEMKQYLFKNK